MDILSKHFPFQDPKQEVAFTAAVTSLSTTWNSGTLIFDVVITNVGNGYNPSTGVFTSPGEGTYLFYVSALEYLQQYLGLEIVLNSVPKVRLIGESAAAYQTGTNMVVLNLQKGDSVWVRHHAGKGYYSHSIPVRLFQGFSFPHRRSSKKNIYHNNFCGLSSKLLCFYFLIIL